MKKRKIEKEVLFPIPIWNLINLYRRELMKREMTINVYYIEWSNQDKICLYTAVMRKYSSAIHLIGKLLNEFSDKGKYLVVSPIPKEDEVSMTIWDNKQQISGKDYIRLVKYTTGDERQVKENNLLIKCHY